MDCPEDALAAVVASITTEADALGIVAGDRITSLRSALGLTAKQRREVARLLGTSWGGPGTAL